MPRSTHFPIAAALVILLVPALCAQTVISAHSGLIHFVAGKVSLDDKTVVMGNNRFPEMKESQVLKTGDGLAEVLLSPGMYQSSSWRAEGIASFLRLAENSQVRLVSNRLTDTKIEFLAGDALIECAEIQKDSKVTLLYKDQAVELHKNGLYRLTGSPAMLRVYRGEATINEGAKVTLVKEGRQTVLNSLAIIEKFDNKLGDSFYRWSKRRSEQVAMANVSSAKSLMDNGYSLNTGLWQWNPWYGMFTYIPARGRYYSPFGFYFYAPGSVYRIYQRPVAPPMVSAASGGYSSGPHYDSNLGYSTISRSDNANYSHSSVSASAPAAASSAAASPRGGDTGGARGSGAGGGRGK